jgi:hypothetical protein
MNVYIYTMNGFMQKQPQQKFDNSLTHVIFKLEIRT